MKRICILIHLGNHGLWEEFTGYIDNVITEDTDIYINFIKELNSKNAIKKQKFKIRAKYPNAIFTSFENRGMDLGGFFVQMKKLSRKFQIS